MLLDFSFAHLFNSSYFIFKPENFPTLPSSLAQNYQDSHFFHKDYFYFSISNIKLFYIYIENIKCFFPFIQIFIQCKQILKKIFPVPFVLYHKTLESKSH